MNISNKHIPTKTLLHFVLLHFALLLCITFCVKSCYILRYRRYYILRQKLLHFALLLHFVAKVITFCVTITFCVSYYILWRNGVFSSVMYMYMVHGNFMWIWFLMYSGLKVVVTDLAIQTMPCGPNRIKVSKRRDKEQSDIGPGFQDPTKITSRFLAFPIS